MKNRSLPAQVISGLLLAVVTLALTACGQRLYVYPQYNFAGRPIPPSGLLQRVMVAYSPSGSSGGLEILDGLRDLRRNIQNTIPSFSISGFSSSGLPVQIISYPEQLTGYVRSYNDGSLLSVNYGAEKFNNSVAVFGAYSPSAVAATDGSRFAGANEAAGLLQISSGGGTISLNLPNVDKVAMNQGNTVILAMVRNSNSLYRVVHLDATTNPVIPPTAVDCQPLLLPVYCVVPVQGNYDHPVNASFSLDGTSVYILNCGPECGGTQASVTVLQEGALAVDTPPTLTSPSPLQSLPVPNPIPVPGGVTAALSDGTTLYLAGQSLQNGLFGGNLSLLNLTSYAVSQPYPISDGTHTKMLFADDNTLWIGSQQCANGPRAAMAAQELAQNKATDQAANYNCLSRVVLGGTAPVVSIVPAVTQGGSNPVTVAYPNTNLNQYYYGDLNGICWVQNYHKVYTGYGGQVHAFKTTDGSEIDNSLITVPGTVFDVAYMDALTNSAN